MDPSSSESAALVPSESELLALRRAKLEVIRALGVDPFGGRFDVTHRPGELRAAFAEGLAVRVLVGEEDRMTPPKYAAFLAAQIPGAALEALLDRHQHGWRAALIHARWLPDLAVCGALDRLDRPRPPGATPEMRAAGICCAGDWVASAGMLADAAADTGWAAGGG